MRKALIFFTIAALCAVVAFHYLPPDFFSIADASSEENGRIADRDQRLPHVVLPSIGDGWVDLSNYKGQVVLIVFWTTWCSGCVDEVPSLIRLQQEFSAKGFTVLAIAVDDEGEESVDSFVRNKQFSVNGASASINCPVAQASDETARKFSGFVSSTTASIATGWSEPVPGRDLHPLKTTTFPQRTRIVGNLSLTGLRKGCS
ncbi:MAG TPA: TlpA disulfide reductase family protein [Candidatus Acidoferrum sp.]